MLILTKVIDKMTTRLVDENGEILRLSGGAVTIIYHIREVKNTQHCPECSTCKDHQYEKIKSGRS